MGMLPVVGPLLRDMTEGMDFVVGRDPGLLVGATFRSAFVQENNTHISEHAAVCRRTPLI